MERTKSNSKHAAANRDAYAKSLREYYWRLQRNSSGEVAREKYALREMDVLLAKIAGLSSPEREDAFVSAILKPNSPARALHKKLAA